MQFFDDRFQAESGWNILTLLGNCMQLVSFMQVFDDRFQAESGWNILTLVGNCMKLTSAECTLKLLMMGREDDRNM